MIRLKMKIIKVLFFHFRSFLSPQNSLEYSHFHLCHFCMYWTATIATICSFPLNFFFLTLFWSFSSDIIPHDAVKQFLNCSLDSSCSLAHPHIRISSNDCPYVLLRCFVISFGSYLVLFEYINQNLLANKTH